MSAVLPQNSAVYMPFQDEKPGLWSPSPSQLEERSCCRHGGNHRRERRGKFLKALAILGTIFIGYKTLVECVRITYGIYPKRARHEISEVCLLQHHF
jgi:hypothetical protein